MVITYLFTTFPEGILEGTRFRRQPGWPQEFQTHRLTKLTERALLGGLGPLGLNFSIYKMGVRPAPPQDSCEYMRAGEGAAPTRSG